MKILVYMFVVVLLGDHVLSQQVDEDISSQLCSQLTAIQTLCNPRDNTPSTSTSCKRCESRPGKRGPKGEVGETGQKGSRGDVGETGPAGIVIQTLLDAQQTRITELNTKVEKLEADNGALKKEVEGIAEILAGINCNQHDGFVHGRDCFFVLDERYAFEAAQSECANLGAHLAYIDTPEVYDAVMPYLRRKVAAAGTLSIYFWFGAEYTGDRRIRFLDGRTITWSHEWRSDNPRALSSFPAWTAMMWEVRASPSSNEGFYNFRTTYPARPICQI